MKKFASSVHLRICIFVFLAIAETRAEEALSSWNSSPARQAIETFVEAVTNPQSKDFVPVEERLAVFDNDGTLWCEQPAYVQLMFAADQVRLKSAQHPEWSEKSPFKFVLNGDMKGLAQAGEAGIMQLVMETHTGMTTDEFSSSVGTWIQQAKHPRFGRSYTECVYQPMLELLQYLRDHQFKVYIVSGGGVEFMRVWSNEVYGVPPEQVIGSSVKLKYVETDGQPRLTRIPEIDFIDDKAGKPVGIHKAIGRIPILAFGNSDGDYEMLRYVTSAPRKSLGLILHHDDSQREYAYDRDSHVGRLNKALDEAPKHNWVVVKMKSDWSSVFPVSENR